MGILIFTARVHDLRHQRNNIEYFTEIGETDEKEE